MRDFYVDVLIVGGGFSGSVLAVQLLHRVPSLSIGIVDKGKLRGRGLAYGTGYRCHLLNVPAGNMSALSEEPEHFVRWARANYEPTVQLRSFLPRNLYGRYIGFLLSHAAMPAEEAFSIQQIRDFVAGPAEVISFTSDGYVLFHNPDARAKSLLGRLSGHH